MCTRAVEEIIRRDERYSEEARQFIMSAVKDAVAERQLPKHLEFDVTVSSLYEVCNSVNPRTASPGPSLGAEIELIVSVMCSQCGEFDQLDAQSIGG